MSEPLMPIQNKQEEEEEELLSAVVLALKLLL